MYDYSCEEHPFFRADAQKYPSKTQQVSTPCAGVSWHRRPYQPNRDVSVCSSTSSKATCGSPTPASTTWAPPTRWSWRRSCLWRWTGEFRCGSGGSSRGCAGGQLCVCGAGLPWRLTSSGACGRSSRPVCPPSSLDTWWVSCFLSFIPVRMQSQYLVAGQKLMEVSLTWPERLLNRQLSLITVLNPGSLDLSEDTMTCLFWISAFERVGLKEMTSKMALPTTPQKLVVF